MAQSTTPARIATPQFGGATGVGDHHRHPDHPDCATQRAIAPCVHQKA